MSELELEQYVAATLQPNTIQTLEELDDYQIFTELDRAEEANDKRKEKQIKKEMTKRGLV